jgi:hypothetical protein
MIDRVNGVYTLFVKGTDGKQNILYGDNGLSGPIRWVNDTTVLYRTVTQTGATDYVVSIDTGKRQKITDVTGDVTTNGQRFSFY